MSFKQVKRSLGYPAEHEPASFEHWFYGQWKGTEVVLLTFSVGAGSSETTYTGVIARVDPPLFLGIGIRKKPFLELFAPPRVTTGLPWVDDRVYLEGLASERVIEFLSPSSAQGRALLERIITNIDELHVSDSTVTFASSGYEVAIDNIRWQLDNVVYIANTLALWRRSFPSTASEIELQTTWRRFADEAGLGFDAERMTVAGKQADGAWIEIALETEMQEIRTSVSVRFPHPVQIAFTVRRTKAPSFLQGLFGQDIHVGDPVFDDLYLVTGHPEEAVRSLLQRPELLRAMKYVGAVTSEVQLNHLQLFFRFQGAASSVDILRSITETARITCASFFKGVDPLGPYR